MSVRASARAHLREAGAAFQENRFDSAMLAACAAVTLTLSQVDVHRARALLPAAEFLECGVVFVTVETGLRAECQKELFSRVDSARALAAAAQLLQAPMPRSLCSTAGPQCESDAGDVAEGMPGCSSAGVACTEGPAAPAAAPRSSAG